MFNCHMNVDICSSIQSVKYLCKKVFKGHDRIQAEMSPFYASNVQPDFRKQNRDDPKYIWTPDKFQPLRPFGEAANLLPVDVPYYDTATNSH